MRLHPKKKCVVILPARLRSNFINEIMSACTMNKYITSAEAATYMSPDTPKRIKSNILKRFMISIAQKYTVMSFERLRIDAMKSPSPRDYLKSVVKNRIVIIDEVHNLINVDYKKEQLETIDNGLVPKKSVTGIMTVLLKTMVKHSGRGTRFIYLTGTPIVDNSKQFGELCKIINPEGCKDVAMNPRTPILSLIPLLKGHVSYFPGSSPETYPSYHMKYTILFRNHTTLIFFNLCEH